MNARHVSLGSMLAMLALAAARPAAATWPIDPAANLKLVSAVSGVEQAPAMVADGVGGMILTWSDTHAGNSNIYAQHVSNKGVVLWAAGGVALCADPSDQTYPCIVPDGAGGAVVCWHDARNGSFDIYAQRIDAAGATQWTSNGVAVCTDPFPQYHLASVSDGAGGVIATWLDERGGDGGDIYARRVNAAGVAQWAANGVPLCRAAGIQQIPLPVSDGAGGAIVVWTDARAGGARSYAQRVSGAGLVQWAADGVVISPNGPPTSIVGDGANGAIVGSEWISSIFAQRVTGAGVTQWFADGTQICISGMGQSRPKAVSDGLGGAIFVWQDQRAGTRPDVYVQRLNSAGTRLWNGSGVLLSSAVGVQQLPELVSDGAGGAIVAWQDTRGVNYDISARRVTAAGVAQWVTDGMEVCNATNVQYFPSIVADGRGGAIVAWYDFRGGAAYDLYAQRIDGFGLMGDPAPEPVSVTDLPNDQGGHVRLKWKASYRDTFPTLGVGAYGVWRQVTAAAAAKAGSRSAIREVATGTQVTYWEGVGSVLARGEATYTFVSDTFQDSTAAGRANTVYMVDAHDATLPRFWSSVPDSGHSVDNLAPAPPAPFTGSYSAGAAHLDWGANLENDLAGYRLYRGTTYGFVPNAGNRVASPTGTHVDVVAPSGSFYKLSAVDVHGNEGGFTPLALSTTGATDPAAPRELALERPTPNPAQSAATIRFALPRATSVTLDVFDAGGRQVRRLADGARAAGEHAERWDLRDGRGLAVPAGLYWIRLSADGRELTQRMTRIR